MVLELAGQTCNISERIETNKYVTRKNPTDLEDAEQEAKEPSLKSSRKMTTAIAQGTQKKPISQITARRPYAQEAIACRQRTSQRPYLFTRQS